MTGGAGYLGSVLVPKLVERGHQVRVLDQAYFGSDSLKLLSSRIELIQKDIRLLDQNAQFRKELFQGCECVIHLAAISNDPSADLNEELTKQINIRATEILAEETKRMKIKFLFSSSCALYGYQEDGRESDEESPLHPLTTYSVSKVEAEKTLMEMSGNQWRPVILRNGTLFGLSPRMRFDLVVNIFSMMSVLYNEIKIFGEGKQWRPFLHVEDCAEAFVFFSEKKELKYPCYNVAHANLRVMDLVPLFERIKPGLKVNFIETAAKDDRDYRVSTKKMRQEGFQTRLDIERGAREICSALASGVIKNPESIYYSNAKWMKELMLNGKLREGKI